MKEIVLDTETTGLSVRDGHRIVEIGCIELDNLVPTKNIFHVYLNPERKVSEKAFEVHGYSDDFLSTKKKFVDTKNREKYLADPNAYARLIEGLDDVEREALVELNQEKMIALGMHPFVSHAFRRVLERAGILVAPAPKNIK